MPTQTKNTTSPKVPKLRFPGFEGVWAEGVLKEVAQVNPTGKRLPDQFIYIDLESVEKGILRQRKQITKEIAPSRAQRSLVVGDVLFQTVRPYQQNNLFFNFVGEYIASTGYAQIRSKEEPLFLYYYLHTAKFLNRVLARCTGSNYPAINSNDLENIRVSLPSFPEKKKIAEFLGAVDEWVQNLRAQKESLEAYKKGIMQKIFSQEVRFKDEDGKDFPAWEEKKLGDIAEIVGGGTPDTAKAGSWNGEINWFTPTEIRKKYTGSSLRKITQVGLKTSSARILPIGTILFTSRATVGEASIATMECATNQGFQSFIVRENNSNEFVYYWIICNKKQFLRRANGSTFLEITGTEIRNMKSFFPSFPEQKKIADFLTSLDNLIESKRQQITEAETWKKGLMQEMFV